MGTMARRFLVGLVVVVLVIGTAAASYLLADHDSAADRHRADRLQTELTQVQDQLRSAAKQNDYLAEQARQGAAELTSAGADSQNKQAQLRAALRKALAAVARTKAKLRGLSSGLSGSVGSVSYSPPAKKGAAGYVEGTETITNSAAIPLSAVCVVEVGGVPYAITSHDIPAGASSTESFRFPYAGSRPSGVSSNGCGRL
jgi:hypothetical protein